MDDLQTPILNEVRNQITRIKHNVEAHPQDRRETWLWVAAAAIMEIETLDRERANS